MKLNLGHHIRTNRRQMNLTQEQLAEKFGTSPQAISRWENGTTYPDLEMIPMIASFFGISVDALLGCTKEEKRKNCEELTTKFFTAIEAEDSITTAEILREIRRNLREYNEYPYEKMYAYLRYYGVYRNETVLTEIRLLSEEIAICCKKTDYEKTLIYMACMEDDKHIDAFLNKNATSEDHSRAMLLMIRHRRREEVDKFESVRQYYIWIQLNNIIDRFDPWWRNPCIPADAAYSRWCCETNLHYLNTLNCIPDDPAYPVSGNGTVDLWCTNRVKLGFRLADSLYRLGEADRAYEVFEDFVSFLENIMAMPYEDEFELCCSCPMMSSFALNSKFEWVQVASGEYKALAMSAGDWCNWVIPSDLFFESHNPYWIGYATMRKDERFAPLLARFENCMITRETCKK